MKTQQTMRTWKQRSTARLLPALAVGLVAGGVWLSSFAQMGGGMMQNMGSNSMMGRGMMGGMMQNMGNGSMMAQCTNMSGACTNQMMGGQMSSCPMMEPGSTNQMMGGQMSCPMMQTAQPKAAAGQAVAYTCPMHPEVVQDKPGKCPKCGMALVEKR